MHSLPKILMVTGSSPDKNLVFEKIIQHLENGIRLIQLRQKELCDDEYKSLAKKIINASKIYNAKILLNADIGIAKQLDADGIHLTSDLLMKTRKRPLPANKIVFASCHNIDELQHARKIEVDFVVLSPVLKTKTHPDYIPIGWKNFSELCKCVDLEIYALGGLTEADLDTAIHHGAYGIAAISSLWDKQYNEPGL